MVHGLELLDVVFSCPILDGLLEVLNWIGLYLWAIGLISIRTQRTTLRKILDHFPIILG